MRREADPRLRVAFVGGRGLGRPHGGIETFYEEVGSRLAGRGHQVTVYCRPGFTPAGTTYRGIRIRCLPTIGSKHFETLVHSFLSILHGSVGSHDLIHIHAIGSSVFSFLPRLFGRPTVVTVHSLDWQFPKWNAVARSCLRIAEWTSVVFPDRTVAVSETLAAYLQDKYAVPVAAIPNGVDLQRPRSSGRILELGLAPGKYVLYVGRLSEEKGPHLLLEAFRQAGPPGFQLVFAGGARYAPEYERALRSRATADTRFLGWVDRETLAELYGGCALFVLPSRLEGLCMALLEAMAAAAPVLVSDIPQNREAVGDAGFLFRSGDRDDLARQLDLILRSPGRRSEAGVRLRRRVQEHYCWDVIVDRIEWLYRSVLEHGLERTPSGRAHARATGESHGDVRSPIVSAAEPGLPVETDLRHARCVIRAVVGDRLRSILAVGSIGRTACENGATARALVEDYDLVAVVDGSTRLGRPFYRRLLSVRALGVPALSLPISVGVLDRRDLPDLPFTLFNYEMRYAHRRLYGPDVAVDMPDYDATRMPIIEATRLLLNRGIYVWGDRLMAERGRLGGSETERAACRVRKVWMALGDALLIAAGRFHWSYSRRIEACRRCEHFDRFADLELRGRYLRAIRSKLSGSPGVVDASAWREELAFCLMAHERVFGFIEELRLGHRIADWRSYANGDLAYPDHLVHPIGRRLIRLIMRFGVPHGARFYRTHGHREAEEVLIRAFPALAYGQARDREFLGRFLNWPVGRRNGPAAVCRRFLDVWARGG